MPKPPLRVETLTHDEAARRNAPTAELEAFVPAAMKAPILAAYARRNPDLDPQLVWRGKDVADWSDLVVEAPPLYIQEKIHALALVEDLKKASTRRPETEAAPDLFADFNGIAPEARTEFYAHDQHWSNRMILGDALKVMASLAEREGLKGKAQCIYIDPPYGIKFNSNFQWSTTSRDVKDGKADHLTREPEQVKAFRDTWRDGIHSYLTYLRDRLTVARDLLTESGSVFVQIGDENVHRVRALMDEVFGPDNYIAQIFFKTTSSLGGSFVGGTGDFVIWYGRNRSSAKYRPLFTPSGLEADVGNRFTRVQTEEVLRRPMMSEERARNVDALAKVRVYRHDNLKSQSGGESTGFDINYEGITFKRGKGFWKTNALGIERLAKSWRLGYPTTSSLSYVRFIDDFPVTPITDLWTDTQTGAFTDDKFYVVQTNTKVVERCILMTTDPGDLVLDPTCGSGTTAYVAEQWGRRWITVDTSRVALALARARIMGARFPWYLLADSREGQLKEGEVTRSVPKDTPTRGRLRQGFVYKRVPHITLKSIANNAEIDTIWEKYQAKLEPLLARMNARRKSANISAFDTASKRLTEKLGKRISVDPLPFQNWSEWQVPRELSQTEVDADLVLDSNSSFEALLADIDGRPSPRKGPDGKESVLTKLHHEWWGQRIARQREIDASIAAKADTEYLYDQPYIDNTRVRVAGPFTVESLSPHRVPAVDVDDSLFDQLEAAEGRRRTGEIGGGEAADFAGMVLDNLRKSGVQQRAREDRLVFSTLKSWPGKWLCAEGRVRQSSDAEDTPERRAAILIGPEYGTVARADLTAAAREAMEAGFDLLIAAAFNFDPHAGEFDRMGALTVLQARINPDLHMPDLANTGAGNLFTVFGEPDIAVHEEADGCASIEVAGIDMYKGGQIESGSADDIAVWFIDTDYNYESFFVRHAYFPGANDPYKALKTTLKAEIDEEAWESLKRTRSRPFVKPAGGRVAVKVINHLGDEVMKVVEV